MLGNCLRPPKCNSTSRELNGPQTMNKVLITGAFYDVISFCIFSMTCLTPMKGSVNGLMSELDLYAI